MANPEVSSGRRRFLTATTAVVGAVGAGFAAVPFIKSWQPSARAQGAGAPVAQDISKLQEGQRLLLAVLREVFGPSVDVELVAPASADTGAWAAGSADVARVVRYAAASPRPSPALRDPGASHKCRPS